METFSNLNIPDLSLFSPISNNNEKDKSSTAAESNKGSKVDYATVSRIKKKDEGSKESLPGGVFYRTSLMAESEIYLLQLGFYGPKDKKATKFTATLQIEYATNSQVVFGPTKMLVNYKEGEEYFYISLGKLFTIKPFVWYTICFDLGEKSKYTFYGDKESRLFEVEGEDKVKFYFSPGSKQMPQIHYVNPRIHI